MSQLAKTLLTTFFTLFTTTLWAVSDSIVISSAADWEEFALRVNSGETGLTGTLAADITVSTMVGTAEHQFEGSFDGQGYTLDISISDSTDAYTAPFHYIHNAHIHHLKVTGSVTHTDSTLTYCHHMSGLVGVAYGENIINDCVVSATISGGDYLSGFLGHGTTSLTTISNCIFNGQILGHSDDAPIGVFCAWADTTTVVICNCLEIGTAYTGNVSSVGCHVSESCAGVYYTAIQGDPLTPIPETGHTPSTPPHRKRSVRRFSLSMTSTISPTALPKSAV